MNNTTLPVSQGAININVADERNPTRTIEIRGVKSYHHGGRIFFDPIEAMRKQHEAHAANIGLEQPRDLALLAALGAPTGNITITMVPYIYHLNKLLFYQWKKMDEQGFGEAFPHDRFIEERKGPVPQNIKEDLERLEDEGFIRIRRPTGAEHQPVPVELTPKGRDAAQYVIANIDLGLLHSTRSSKEQLLPLTPRKVMDKVHSEYPEFRRKWVEVDDS